MTTPVPLYNADARWTCSRCRKKVSKQMGQHKHLRQRRSDGTGWDHVRCQRPTREETPPTENAGEQLAMFALT